MTRDYKQFLNNALQSITCWKKAKTGQFRTASNKKTECLLVLGLKQPLSSDPESVGFQSAFPSVTVNALKHLDVTIKPPLLHYRLMVPKYFGRETSSALTDKQISLLTLARFSQRLSQDLMPQPLIELRWPISSGVCNKKLPWLSIFGGFKRCTMEM